MSERPPKFDVAAIERRRDALYAEVFSGYVGRAISGDDVSAMARRSRRWLPRTSEAVLFESLRLLAGHTADRPLLFRTAWRLAGNLERLQQGFPSLPWVSQPVDEWVPLQVLTVTPGRNRRGDFGGRVKGVILAGTACPLKPENFWSYPLAKAVARKVGFSRARGRFPFSDILQFVGLRFCVKLLSAKSQGEPRFFDIACPGSMVKWNRQNVLTLRLRVGVACPRGYTHPCHRCAVGYRECPAGTHRLNYERGHCPQCNQIDAVFDADLGSCCIECTHKQLLARKP
jgi:hypothetical protein